MTIFITGATGFIGRSLIRDLLRKGHRVLALTRDRRRMQADTLGIPEDRLLVVEGDPAQAGPWQKQLAGCDAVVALAGEPLAGKRWTPAFLERLEQSRIGALNLLCEALSAIETEARPKVLLAASAVGYYGPRGAEEVSEETAAGTDYLAQLCHRWEAASAPCAALGLRVCNLRIGVVLGDGGGALAKMVPAFRAFVGGPLGGGTQYVPWIHLQDVVALISLALQKEIAGPINLCSPNPVTMEELATTLGQVLHRPSLLRVPSFVLKATLGQAADVLLTGQRVVPRRALGLGYRFLYPDLRAALMNLLTT